MLLLRLHRLGFLHVLILFLSMTSKKIHFLFTFLKFGGFFCCCFWHKWPLFISSWRGSRAERPGEDFQATTEPHDAPTTSLSFSSDHFGFGVADSSSHHIMTPEVL